MGVCVCVGGGLEGWWGAGKQVCSLPCIQLIYLLMSPSVGFLTVCSPALTSELFTENKLRFKSLTQTPSDREKPECSYSLREQRPGREARKERDSFPNSLYGLSAHLGKGH